MTETEIQMFIETMEELGDEWIPEEVKRVYGGYTYEDAINHRRKLWAMEQSNLALFATR